MRPWNRHLLVTLAVTLLAGLGLYAVPPVQADDPIPLTFMELHGGSGQFETDPVKLTAVVNTYPNPAPLGTVTFTSDKGWGPVVAPLVPNGATQSLVYLLEAPAGTGTTTYTAVFHSTNGYADGTAVLTVTAGHLKKITVTPEPTVGRIKLGLVPQLTLTPSAYARLDDGSPMAGVPIDFTYACQQLGPWMDCSGWRTICHAVTNGAGFATCGAAGTLASVVSLLGAKVYARAGSPDREVYGIAYLNNNDQSPVILLS